jgi:16S rRNA processing protein RimM
LKAVKSAPKAEPKKPAPPKPEPKAATKAASEKAPKAAKPKPEKPPKLAPVAAALAKPIPAKPLAVAAGRAQPITRSLSPPPRSAPKPLAAPKPVTPDAEVVGELQSVPAFKGKAGGAKGMVLVGAIAGAFGVKGEVRLRAFTDRKDGVIAYGPLYGEDGKIVLRPKSWRELKDGVAIVAPEVKTREEAEKLRGQKLFVPRANLPSTAEDEFYIVDLLGSRAEALDGTVLGDIVAVWNFGAGDILEYRPPNGGPNVRITFTKETVPHVDLAAKRVVIDPPAPEPVGK